MTEKSEGWKFVLGISDDLRLFPARSGALTEMLKKKQILMGKTNNQ